MENRFKYIIVGGGLAGASAVEGIREHDKSGSLALFGKEQHLPYDRPPLSKGLWLGKTTVEKLPVHDKQFYTERHVHLHLGAEINIIDREKKEVRDSEGKSHRYEKLLIATGGVPRILPFGGDAIHYFRTVDDYHMLNNASEKMDEFILLGGGFIGAELAAALTMKNKKVTLVFPDRLLLHRVLPHDLAEYVTEYYGARGVNVLADSLPTSVESVNGRKQVTTKNGKLFSGEMVIAAIGLNLNIDVASAAGLKIDNGIDVNNILQTSDPDIFAAGDVAYFPAKSLDKKIRVEHWNNAQTQGKYAGENMAGAGKPYDYLPYFYSDLFDLGFEAVGDLDSRMETFADWKEKYREGVVYYLREDKVKGVLLWNVWDKVDAARDLINRKKTYSDHHELENKL